jgi:hypothetical protein
VLVPGFLLPFGRRHSLLGSSCARCGVQLSSRSAYRRRRRPAGPQRGCRVAHEQDPTGQGASLTPGTVVRSRPAVGLRSAPAAFPRPVPAPRYRIPSAGPAFTRRHQRFTHVRPSPQDSRPLSRDREASRSSRRSSPRPPPPDGTAAASASTPGFAPRGYPRRTPRRRRAIAHWPGYYAATSAALHGASHFTHAPSRRTQP